MVNGYLSAGRTIVGLLVDGVPDTPLVACTVVLDDRVGVVLELPFAKGVGAEHLVPVDRWVNGDELPENLTLEAVGKVIGLYGTRVIERSLGGSVERARIGVQEAVMGVREIDHARAFAIGELRSQIDGLQEWTRFRASSTETSVDDAGVRRLVITVAAVDEFTWQQGDALMRISNDWRHTDGPDGMEFEESVVLTSTFTNSRPFQDHYAEQRKVVALLTLMLGVGIRFRRHEVKDSRFPTEVMGTPHFEFHELLSSRTIQDYTIPKPDPAQMRIRGIAYLQQLKPEDLVRWAENYEAWRRVIDPTVGVLSRSGLFVEDVVISTNLSLESAGHILPHADGEEDTFSSAARPTSATFVYRAVQSLDLDWAAIADTPIGLARAVATNYNTIKHHDRGAMPPAQETHLIGELSLIIVRLLALNVLDPTGQRTKDATHARGGVIARFQQSKLRIDDSGNFVSGP